jgi:hypothetical protein
MVQLVVFAGCGKVVCAPSGGVLCCGWTMHLFSETCILETSALDQIVIIRGITVLSSMPFVENKIAANMH